DDGVGAAGLAPFDRRRKRTEEVVDELGHELDAGHVGVVRLLQAGVDLDGEGPPVRHISREALRHPSAATPEIEQDRAGRVVTQLANHRAHSDAGEYVGQMTLAVELD